MEHETVEKREVVLEAEQCVRVALYMVREWEKDMQPPVFAVYDFPTWLNRLAKKHNIE